MNFFTLPLLITVCLIHSSQASDVPSSSDVQNVVQGGDIRVSELSRTTTLEEAINLLITYNNGNSLDFHSGFGHPMGTFLQSPENYQIYIPHLHQLAQSLNDNKKVFDIILDRLKNLNIFPSLRDADTKDNSAPGKLQKECNKKNAKRFIKNIIDQNYQPKKSDPLSQEKFQELVDRETKQAMVIKNIRGENQREEKKKDLFITQMNENIEKLHQDLESFRSRWIPLPEIIATCQSVLTPLNNANIHYQSIVQEYKDNVYSIFDAILLALTDPQRSNILDDIKNLESFYTKNGQITNGDRAFQIIMLYMNIKSVKYSERLTAASNLIFDNMNTPYIRHLVLMVFKDAKGSKQENPSQ